MNIKLFLLLFVYSFFLFSCKADLEELQDFNKNSYSLINQDSTEIIFPDLVKGKIAVVGYIFTNCYDVCPLTTNNMRIIQEKVKEENISDVEFVSISFDPDVDKPARLRSFAKVRDLDLSNWEFLTGDKKIIDKLIKDVGMVVVIADSTIYKDGSKSYYYVHTDRIQLVDQNGILRKNYVGSKIRIDEIVSDIKYLRYGKKQLRKKIIWGLGITDLLLVIVLFLLFVLLWLIPVVDILKNEFIGNNKIVWLLVMLFLPLLGGILYLLIGINQKK